MRSRKQEVGSRKQEVGSRKQEVGSRKKEIESSKQEVGLTFDYPVQFNTHTMHPMKRGKNVHVECCKTQKYSLLSNFCVRFCRKVMRKKTFVRRKVIQFHSTATTSWHNSTTSHQLMCSFLLLFSVKSSLFLFLVLKKEVKCSQMETDQLTLEAWWMNTFLSIKEELEGT